MKLILTILVFLSLLGLSSCSNNENINPSKYDVIVNDQIFLAVEVKISRLGLYIEHNTGLGTMKYSILFDKITNLQIEKRGTL